MASEKARYWMAVGVAALFLGNSFVGSRSLTPSVTDRSMATAQRISGQAMRYAMLAQVMLGRGEAGFVHAQTATACAQTRLAVVQTAMAHREAAQRPTEFEHMLRSEEHTSELQSRQYLVCRLLLEKK